MLFRQVISRHLATRSIHISRFNLSSPPYALPIHGDSRVYEIRKYDIHLSQLASFRRLTEEKLGLRTRHSSPLGYWQNELGALNSVFHIWPYESLEHRARIRQALAGDKEWNEEYVKHLVVAVQAQTNCVSTLIGGLGSGAMWPASGVYQSLEITFDTTVSQEESLRRILRFLNPYESQKFSAQHMATFQPLVGNLATYWTIFRYHSLHEFQQSEILSPPENAALFSRMMLPWPWDNWQRKQ